MLQALHVTYPEILKMAGFDEDVESEVGPCRAY